MSINPLNDISKVYLEQVANTQVDIEEGMTLQDYKKKRSALKQKEKRAADKIAPNRRKDIHTDRYSPERAARHRANVDPDFEGNDERNYPGGKLKNPKKIRKAKALGELGEEYMDEASYSAKAARAGKDIGKPGKAFAKIAASAAKRYGSKERGEKVAGAVLAKLRAKRG